MNGSSCQRTNATPTRPGNGASIILTPKTTLERGHYQHSHLDNKFKLMLMLWSASDWIWKKSLKNAFCTLLSFTCSVSYAQMCGKISCPVLMERCAHMWSFSIRIMQGISIKKATSGNSLHKLIWSTLSLTLRSFACSSQTIKALVVFCLVFNLMFCRTLKNNRSKCVKIKFPRSVSLIQHKR